MPIDYSKYPANWKTEIRPAILKRAGERCEQCGTQNYAIGYRDKNGTFHAVHSWDESVKEKHHLFRIVLTVAHLDHDTGNNSPENLAALCQKCHLAHDKEQHKATRHKHRLREWILAASKQTGLTERDIVHALAVLSGGTIEEADVLNNFRNNLAEKYKPTNEAVKEAEELGILLLKKQEI